MSETTDKPKPTGLALLREPFPPHQVSQLPKPTAKREVMDKLPKAKCNVCGGYHATEKVIHLDYVGHAALTDRLLDADPAWSWEPLAFTDHGLPLFDSDGGLWIKLTVCGVTRMGYGNAERKSFADAGAREKEIIGDALRNAAMRFGAALELWHKGKLHEVEEDDTPKPPKGYDDWRVDMTACASEGLARYAEAWKASKAAYREYANDHDADWHAANKATAKQADDARAKQDAAEGRQ